MPCARHIRKSADNNVATRSVPYRLVTRAVMYHQIAWFVDNQNIVIFINKYLTGYPALKTNLFVDPRINSHPLAA